MKKSYVYLLTNINNTVLYTGITSDLIKRVYQHKYKLLEGFTKKYNVSKLVYFEEFSDIEIAILREKEIKGWKREKKNNLINADNKEWKDLYSDLI